MGLGTVGFFFSHNCLGVETTPPSVSKCDIPANAIDKTWGLKQPGLLGTTPECATVPDQIPIAAIPPSSSSSSSSTSSRSSTPTSSSSSSSPTLPPVTADHCIGDDINYSCIGKPIDKTKCNLDQKLSTKTPQRPYACHVLYDIHVNLKDHCDTWEETFVCPKGYVPKLGRMTGTSYYHWYQYPIDYNVIPLSIKLKLSNVQKDKDMDTVIVDCFVQGSPESSHYKPEYVKARKGCFKSP